MEFNSNVCLKHLIKQIKEHPEWIGGKLQLITSEQRDNYKNVLWPSCINPESWQRVATLRPPRDENEGSTYGSDKVIRVYENEEWYPRLLKAEVITEFGNFKDVIITIS
jgi:hypothetical protein